MKYNKQLKFIKFHHHRYRSYFISGLRENTEKEKMDRDFQVNNNWSQKNENSISLDEKIKRDQVFVIERVVI